METPSRFRETRASRLSGMIHIDPANRTSTTQPTEPTKPTTPTMKQKQEFKESCRVIEKQQLAAVLLSLVVMVVLAAVDGAVVRPTVFSDLPLQDPQQQQQSALPAPNQNVVAASTATLAAAAASISTNNNNIAPSAPVSPAQSGAPQPFLPEHSSTKVNPLKSRLCSNQAGQRFDSPLGLQSYEIDDLALSASSYSNDKVGPHLARLNMDIEGGAWCPMMPIGSSQIGKEWIQAKLNRSFVISAIETQGRYGMGSGKEFVPNYQVEYSRNGGQTWHKWKDFRGSNLLRGNEDTMSAVKNELAPPIVGANAIRLLPYSHHLRTVCLRFELHGCPYDEGAPIAYSTSDGVAEARWGHLIDHTYDGTRQLALGTQVARAPTSQPSLLSQGLGQLVDGVKGADNFSFNSGFEWVGWKSMNGDVVIEFTFKTLRNFTGALFHSNNLFSAGVEVFQGVDVHYGIEAHSAAEPLRDALFEQRRRGAPFRSNRQVHSEDIDTALSHSSKQTMWSPDILSIEYEPDKKNENSRPVTVHLKQRLANKLKFVLKFASKWILVSEVEFLSHPIELLSLSSLNDRATPDLLHALAPAKTYDQYVAILREHQLRRIVTSFMTITQSPAPVAADSPAEPSSSPNTGAPELMPFPLNNDLPPNWPDLTPLPEVPGTFTVPSSTSQNGPMATGDLTQSSSSNSIINGADRYLPAQPLPGKQTTMGLATVISLILVLIVIMVGVLFAISSYRFKSLSKSPLGSKGFGGPNLHNFMSVFSANQPGAGVVGQGQEHAYNAIFATASRQDNESTRSTLRRLAGLGTTKGSHFGTQSSPGSNQLLVSVKDSTNQLFAANQHQRATTKAVNSRLIVGLNQANPLAQQQVYNNCNQTYAPHYSTSMSMTSSSTTGHQGDYADYAIPDAQPMIPPIQQHQQHHMQHHSDQFNNGFQHLNPGFTTLTQHGHMVQSKPLGYQTEMRASGRRIAHQTTLIQPQQVIHQKLNEHNYEDVYPTRNNIKNNF